MMIAYAAMNATFAAHLCTKAPKHNNNNHSVEKVKRRDYSTLSHGFSYHIGHALFTTSSHGNVSCVLFFNLEFELCM